MAPRAASPSPGRSAALRGLRASDYDDAPGPGALRGTSRAWWRGAAPPLAAAALSLPAVAALVPSLVAPLAAAALLLSLLLHRWEQGRWPVPRAAALLLLLALAAWVALSALWAADPGRALTGAGLLAGLAWLGAAGAVVVEEAGPAARRVLGWCALAGLMPGLALAAIGASPGGMAEPGSRAVAAVALFLPVLLRLRAAAPWRWLLLLCGMLAAVLPGGAAALPALAGTVAAALVAAGGRTASGVLALALAGGLLAAPVLSPSGTGPDAARPLTGEGLEAGGSAPSGRLPAGAAPTEAGRGFQRLPDPIGAAPLRLLRELGWVGLALGALTLLALAWDAAPAVAGLLAAAAATALAGDAWAAWWPGALALVGALTAGLSARRD